jgi:hypothetical protein
MASVPINIFLIVALDEREYGDIEWLEDVRRVRR